MGVINFQKLRSPPTAHLVSAGKRDTARLQEIGHSECCFAAVTTGGGHSEDEITEGEFRTAGSF